MPVDRAGNVMACVYCLFADPHFASPSEGRLLADKHTDKELRDEANWFTCHYHAPRPSSDPESQALFPIVGHDQWCRHFVDCEDIP